MSEATHRDLANGHAIISSREGLGSLVVITIVNKIRGDERFLPAMRNRILPEIRIFRRGQIKVSRAS